MLEKGSGTRIHCKIVYCGPAGSGKATSLHKIYGNIHPYRKGELRYAHRGLDQVIDVTFEAKVGGIVARIHLTTVTGALSDPQTLVEILRDASGVVFVADSSPESLRANIESLNLLEQALAARQLDLETLPHILEFNKRDLDDALPVEDLERDINRYRAASRETIAHEGRGVEDVLISLLARVFQSMYVAQEGETSKMGVRAHLRAVQGRSRRGRPGMLPSSSTAALEALLREQRRAAKKRKREIEKALKMAKVFLDLQDYEESLRWAKEVLELDSSHSRGKEIFHFAKEKLDQKIDTLYHEALAHLEGGDAVAAGEKLEMILEMHPRHKEARDLLEAARAKMVQRLALPPRPAREKKKQPAVPPTPKVVRKPEAQERARRIHELLRESEELYAREDFDGTIQVLKRMKQLVPTLGKVDVLLSAVRKKKSQRLEQMMSDARTRIDSEQYEEAARILNHVLEQDSDNEAALELLEKATQGIIGPPPSEEREEVPRVDFEEEPLEFLQRATTDMIEESLNLLKPKPRQKTDRLPVSPAPPGTPDDETARMIEKDLDFLLEAAQLSRTESPSQRRPK